MSTLLSAEELEIASTDRKLFRFIQALRVNWSLWGPGKLTLTPAHSGESWKDLFLCLLGMGKLVQKGKERTKLPHDEEQSENILDWKRPQEIT